MTPQDWLALGLFVSLLLALLLGFPVALTLGGVALLYAGLGIALGVFDPSFLDALPNRVFGVVGNETLLAVPLFVFMGVMLERSKVAERLLTMLAALFGGLRGGLALSVLAVGAVLAASTGIVGATVVTFPVVMVAWFQWGWGPDFIWVTVAYLVIQALDGNVLVPLLFGEVVNLHPIAIIVAILVFGGLWGFWGVFFAIPLATLVNAVLRAWPKRKILPRAAPV